MSRSWQTVRRLCTGTPGGLDSVCGQDRAADLGDADPAAVRPGCGGGDGDLVAVLQERPDRTVAEGQRLGTAPAQLEQAATLVRRRAADGAGGEQVTGTQRGAVDGEMG